MRVESRDYYVRPLFSKGGETRTRLEMQAQRKRLQDLFSLEMGYSRRQEIMDGIIQTDFRMLRSNFSTFSDLFGRRVGRSMDSSVKLLLERYLKVHEVAVGKIERPSGNIRFILATDAEKAKTLIGELVGRK